MSSPLGRATALIWYDKLQGVPDSDFGWLLAIAISTMRRDEHMQLSFANLVGAEKGIEILNKVYSNKNKKSIKEIEKEIKKMTAMKPISISPLGAQRYLDKNKK